MKTAENWQQEPPLSSRTELSNFLASVERRAFKQAMFAIRNEETSLDIVQDAMMRLAEKYGDRPGRVADVVPAYPAKRHPRQLSAIQGAVPVDNLAFIAFHERR
jgi:hypothetical protein